MQGRKPKGWVGEKLRNNVMACAVSKEMFDWYFETAHERRMSKSELMGIALKKYMEGCHSTLQE